MTVPWPYALAVLLSALCALTDHRRRVIPNGLTLPALAAAPLVHGWFGGAWGLGGSVAAALVCFAPAYLLFRRGALGGGDVKLFAALGALLGLRTGLELEFAAFALVSCAVFAFALLRGGFVALARRSLHASLYLVHPSRFARPEPDVLATEVPMGGAIFVAVVGLALRSAL